MDSKSTQTQKSAAQRSIKSFFQPQLPKYSSPPGGSLTPTSSDTSQHVDKPAASTGSPLTQATSILPDLKVTESPPTFLPTLPPQATISRVEAYHIQQLRRINALLLPINYPDSFYQNLVDPRLTPNFSRVVLWGDTKTPQSAHSNSNAKVVGSITCRVDENPSTSSNAIYILSLGILSPYRSLGLATALLETVVHSVVNTPELRSSGSLLYAHVWTENTDALQWYLSRGFQKEDTVIQGYYRRLRPDTAWVVYRDLTTTDYIKYSRQTTSSIPATSTNMSVTTATPPKSVLSPPPSANEQRGPALPPPPKSGSASSTASPSNSRPPIAGQQQRGTSYQTVRPANEWNDLPEDMMKTVSQTSTPGTSTPVSTSGVGSRTELEPPSSGSSRSSSRNPPGKKKRAYPAAAFDAGK